MVTDCDLSRVQSASFIAKEKESVTSEWCVLDRLSVRHDFNATNCNLIFRAVLLHLTQRVEVAHRHLCGSALRTKCRDFRLFTHVLDREHLTHVESCS